MTDSSTDEDHDEGGDWIQRSVNETNIEVELYLLFQEESFRSIIL